MDIQLLQHLLEISAHICSQQNMEMAHIHKMNRENMLCVNNRQMEAYATEK